MTINLEAYDALHNQFAHYDGGLYVQYQLVCGIECERPE